MGFLKVRKTNEFKTLEENLKKKQKYKVMKKNLNGRISLIRLKKIRN